MMRNKVPTIWSAAYCYEGAPTNSATKQLEVVDRATKLGLLERLPPRNHGASFSKTVDAITTVHDPRYVEAVLSGDPRGLAESQAFAWSPALATAVVDIFGGQITAAAWALMRATNHPTQWAAVLHPVSGAHHARYDRGSGFCTFNFLMALLTPPFQEYQPLIIDLDAHAGDGTLQLIQQHKAEWPAVFDIAEFMIEFSPPTPTATRQSLHAVSNAVQYREALLRLPAFLDQHQPGLVFYQAGMDPHVEDPIGGIKGVTRTFLQWRDRFVLQHLKDRNIPTVVNLAGGYQERAPILHVDTIIALSELLHAPAGVAV